MWIWQQENWPHFTWDKNVIEPMLREARLNQGILLGKMASQSYDKKQSMLDTLLANIVNSSAIEGEKLNAQSSCLHACNTLRVKLSHRHEESSLNQLLTRVMQVKTKEQK